MKKLCGLSIILSVICIVMCFAVCIGKISEKKEMQEIVDFLQSDTEDSGDYVIGITKAKSKTSFAPNTIYYYVDFIDSDGDYEKVVVIYEDGKYYEVPLY